MSFVSKNGRLPDVPLYPNGKNGNSTRINPEAGITPLYQNFPLTSYRYHGEGGVAGMDISDADVIRMRNFDMENKK